MTATKVTTTTTKKCFIVRRYTVKSSGSICAIIRNERGVEYTACLHSNGRTSCTCPARGLCYHIRHLHATEYARTHGVMSIQEVEQNNCATMTEKASVSAQTSKDSSTVSQARPTVTVASMSSVERNAPVWLMRGFSSNGWMTSAGSK